VRKVKKEIYQKRRGKEISQSHKYFPAIVAENKRRTKLGLTMMMMMMMMMMMKGPLLGFL